MTFGEMVEKYEGEIVDHTQPAEAPVASSEGVETDESGRGGSLPPIEMGSAILGDYFGYSALESHAPGMKNKLDEIYLMAKGFGVDDVKGYLDFIEERIGEPKLGISRADHVYQYLKLASRASDAYREVEKYENKGGVSGQPQSDTVRTPAEIDGGVSGEGEMGGDT